MELQADHLPSFSAEINNTWSNTFTPCTCSYCNAWLNRHREKLICISLILENGRQPILSCLVLVSLHHPHPSVVCLSLVVGNELIQFDLELLVHKDSLFQRTDFSIIPMLTYNKCLFIYAMYTSRSCPVVGFVISVFQYLWLNSRYGPLPLLQFLNPIHSR
jgi:hypothetical protein